MSEVIAKAVQVFMERFDGFDEAYGTGKGGWIETPPTPELFAEHLQGETPIGIGPLRRDGTITFAAIDLDEPDFEAAVDMAILLPGHSWIEKSRSGNAHVFAFFKAPVEAWVVRGIMREATAAAGKKGVEVFPKQDTFHAQLKFGSYINLPYHGDDRPFVWTSMSVPGEVVLDPNSPVERLRMEGYSLEAVLPLLQTNLNDPSDWRKRAQWLGVPDPAERKATGKYELGQQPYLHMCAEYVIEHREDNPVTEGHRNAVFFALSKQLHNCKQYDDDEAWMMVTLVNDASPEPMDEGELRRIFDNGKQFQSTGCDDPLFEPFAHPSCPIAHGR